MNWYFARNGAQQGPVSEDVMRNSLRTGELGPKDLVWREGMGDWLPVSDVPELAELMTAPQAATTAAIPASPPYYVESPTEGPATLSYANVYPQYVSPFPGAYPGGFWWRVLAYIVDYLILYVPNLIISLLLRSAAVSPSGGRSPVWIGIMALSSGISLIIGWLYYALQESSAAQATVGKRVCGLVVTDLEGRRISFGRASGRHFGKILSGVLLGIGFLMVAFTNRKQGLHDQLASTLVWKK